MGGKEAERAQKKLRPGLKELFSYIARETDPGNRKINQIDSQKQSNAL